MQTLRFGISLLVVATWSAPSHAQSVGDILLPEFSEGSIVNIRKGGDLSAAKRFVTGLDQPTAVCQGPDERLYAAEFELGQIIDITTGGDVAKKAAFASGLSGPIALHCTMDRILVVENESGEITDITMGGDFTEAPSFASGLVSPTSIFLGPGNTLWVTSRSAGLINVTEGGNLANVVAWAQNDLPKPSPQTTGVSSFLGRLLVIDQAANGVFDVSATGPISAAARFATVLSPVGMYYAKSQTEMLVASAATETEASSIVSITDCDPDLANCAKPFATGVNVSFTAQMTTITAVCGNSKLEGREACDDGNTSSEDACTDRCAVAVCGDGLVNPAEEECDDGNVDENDECLMTCTVPVCGDGVMRSSSEECDDGNLEDNDECTASCKIAFCGDGIVQAGEEQCDDANDEEQDACTKYCVPYVDVSVWGCNSPPATPGLWQLLVIAGLLTQRRWRR